MSSFLMYNDIFLGLIIDNVKNFKRGGSAKLREDALRLAKLTKVLKDTATVDLDLSAENVYSQAVVKGVSDDDGTSIKYVHDVLLKLLDNITVSLATIDKPLTALFPNMIYNREIVMLALRYLNSIVNRTTNVARDIQPSTDILDINCSMNEDGIGDCSVINVTEIGSYNYDWYSTIIDECSTYHHVLQKKEVIHPSWFALALAVAVFIDSFKTSTPSPAGAAASSPQQLLHRSDRISAFRIIFFVYES